MKVTVIEAYTPSFSNPISLKKGETAQVGKRDTKFVGWIWTTTSDGNSGWAPETLLDINGAAATAREDYHARELNTQIGEELTVGRELNGWYWVSNAAGETGWIPVSTVTKR